jgi:hypothetical protein
MHKHTLPANAKHSIWYQQDFMNAALSQQYSYIVIDGLQEEGTQVTKNYLSLGRPTYRVSGYLINWMAELILYSI